jgi:hypothetical protein
MAGVLKVRDQISDDALDHNEDPGWYEHPKGTVAHAASEADLRRDGIEV